MGCTESIISEIVAKSNSKGQKVTKNQAKVQPASLQSDRGDRDEARERRRKAVMERHAKRQAMAQTISENAMAEKERLSNSTWRSWRSGVNSDIISPTVSISVRGSDGTASPDHLPNPAIAYSEDANPSTQPEQDINANDMQIRTIDLPNQVTEGADELSTENREPLGERLGNSGANETTRNEQGDTFREGSKSTNEQKALQEPLLNGNGPQGESRKDIKDDIIPLMDDEKEKMEKERKKKRRGKQKAVKFTDQDLGDETLKESAKETSKGR